MPVYYPVYYPSATAGGTAYTWVTTSVTQTATAYASAMNQMYATNQTAATTWPVPPRSARGRGWWQPQTREEAEQEPLDAQAFLEQREQAAREMQAERQRREAAKRRATELLLEHLSLEQRKTFVENKWFVVEGGSTKMQYRINENHGSTLANIDVIDRGRILMRLCGHIQHGLVPHSDQLLAQKMMLEFDEEAFLRLANRHPA